ncbi:translation initiation factor 4E [[Emmonsia] crescens]|uniref:Translation initiation factor 4E n=1 Tax=[Emmonsia] crescens TaxID=73230 RepID=A0A2B7ZEG3_9EURO|nr:translation initiation factor 4E [Emmonsia crescens]
MDNANLWTRRSNTSKLSLSTSGSDSKDGSGRQDSARSHPSKRFGPDSSHGRSNPFNAISPLTTNAPSPSVGASSAFGLGSGAFASFGSAKTPKTPGAFDLSTPKPSSEKRETQPENEGTNNKTLKSRASSSSLNNTSAPPAPTEHPIRSTWIVWYRPPTPKYSDYEKSTIALASISSVESFWAVYSHLKRPSLLPAVSDYHIFKKGIRPVWEDEANKRGGKWIVRLKKGVADRYWEDLLLAMVGDQFAEASDEVCGAVLSVRSGEDVLSVWTRIDGGRNIKIRETIKRLLAFPPDTNIVWKSHDDSIAQRSAIDQARQDKAAANAGHHHQGSDRRRGHNQDDTSADKGRSAAS